MIKTKTEYRMSYITDTHRENLDLFIQQMMQQRSMEASKQSKEGDVDDPQD